MVLGVCIPLALASAGRSAGGVSWGLQSRRTRINLGMGQN